MQMTSACEHRALDKTCIDINTDDGELKTYQTLQHLECISNTLVENTNYAAAAAVAAADHTTDDSMVLKQVTASIARQTKVAATSNQLHKDKIDCEKESNDEMKVRT